MIVPKYESAMVRGAIDTFAQLNSVVRDAAIASTEGVTAAERVTQRLMDAGTHLDTLIKASKGDDALVALLETHRASVEGVLTLARDTKPVRTMRHPVAGEAPLAWRDPYAAGSIRTTTGALRKSVEDMDQAARMARRLRLDAALHPPTGSSLAAEYMRVRELRRAGASTDPVVFNALARPELERAAEDLVASIARDRAMLGAGPYDRGAAVLAKRVLDSLEDVIIRDLPTRDAHIQAAREIRESDVMMRIIKRLEGEHALDAFEGRANSEIERLFGAGAKVVADDVPTDSGAVALLSS